MASSSSSSTTTPLLSSPPSSITTTPLLSSLPSSITDLQQNWLNNSTQTFINHLNTNPNLQTCIFHLPETLTSQKPDSYIPKHIGLGPIQHFRSDIYTKQEQLKLTTSKTVLEPYNITPEFHKTLHNKLTDLVPDIRCSYDLYFGTSDECLSWVFVVDALFLLDVLLKVSKGYSLEYLEDIIMVENQIPLVVLSQLITTIKQHSNEEIDDLDLELTHMLVKVCETCSPLKFTRPETQIDLDDVSNTSHLLDCMYHLIITHKLAPENPFVSYNFLLDMHLEDVENAVQRAGGLFPGLNVFLQPVLLVLKLPWDKIMTLIKKMFGEVDITSVEIDIPSVSRLSKIGKVDFASTDGGIHDIKFDEVKPMLTLPVLDLKPVSEVVLRNLVAYEELMFMNDNIKNLDFGEYVELMCGIVDGVKDVKILREKNIIEGDMKDEDIVKLFNGIGKSSVKKDGMKSELQKTIEKVSGYYGGIPRVKVCNFIKKVFLASWKVLLVVFSVVSLVLVVLTGVCQVYDCKSRFGLGYVHSVLDYVTGNQVVDW